MSASELTESAADPTLPLRRAHRRRHAPSGWAGRRQRRGRLAVLEEVVVSGRWCLSGVPKPANWPHRPHLSLPVHRIMIALRV